MKSVWVPAFHHNISNILPSHTHIISQLFGYATQNEKMSRLQIGTVNERVKYKKHISNIIFYHCSTIDELPMIHAHHGQGFCSALINNISKSLPTPPRHITQTLQCEF